ncbi:MAG: hypothetical protein M1829_000311 [Trizodia sp. TS-e1964]|nr:MAG: hypothetical protein M1829_000311 [Trizodia sp. TS-e1964]
MLLPRSLLFSNVSLTLIIIFFCSLFTPSSQTKYVQGVDALGNAVQLDDSRPPALYTNKFGDCLGSSLINVTRFDAAYYKDNMTVLFHLEGSTGIHNESLMMYIGVFAYGVSRFDITFNPCDANILSLCPMKAGVPIEANGVIPISPANVEGIPDLAYGIPDFEGQAVLRIFANSTESQIGCYSAAVTNGVTFSHPEAVGSVLGLFTIIALVASLATALYGTAVVETRKHYAHSLSMLVVFSVLQHIFYSGALSLNFPSVLASFWSNFAWTGGMIYSPRIESSINTFLGVNSGDGSFVGAAQGSQPLPPSFSIQALYQQALPKVARRAINIRSDAFTEKLRTRGVAANILKRALENSTDGYSYYGSPVKPGLPLPGNYTGFAGTLSTVDIPASNAFITGFIWLLALLAIVTASVVALKWVLEALSVIRIINKDRLGFFRTNWIACTRLVVLRVLLISFFMMMTLTMFQFTQGASAGVNAIAALTFLFIFFGLVSAVAYACYYRLKYGHYVSEPDRLVFEKTKLWGTLPWYKLSRKSQDNDANQSEKIYAGSLPWWRVHHIDNDPDRVSVHEDTDFIMKFGWLSARFRRTRWWFFAVWLTYEFVRACFYGGAAGHPLTQVFGLLLVEIIALIVIIAMRPFEGARLNALMVYLLGFSKVATLALSASFDIRFNLDRIITTVIGIVIIVIQGILTIVLLIAIVVGAISSYMSVSRNHEKFKPKSWSGLREKYLKHIEKAAADLPPPPPPIPQAPVEPYFSVASVRRCPKIEDEDEEFINELGDPTISRQSPLGSPRASPRASKAGSMHSTRSNYNHSSLPRGARVHRASWSSREFNSWHESVGGGERNSGQYGIAPSSSGQIHIPQAIKKSDSSGSLERHFSMASGGLPSSAPRIPSPLNEGQDVITTIDGRIRSPPPLPGTAR